MQGGDYSGALEVLGRAVTRTPADGKAWGRLGICQTKLGNVDAGISALREAATLQPADASAQYNLGVALLQAHRVPEAQLALGQALHLNPSHGKAMAALKALDAGSPNQAPEAQARLSETGGQSSGVGTRSAGPDGNGQGSGEGAASAGIGASDRAARTAYPAASPSRMLLAADDRHRDEPGEPTRQPSPAGQNTASGAARTWAFADDGPSVGSSGVGTAYGDAANSGAGGQPGGMVLGARAVQEVQYVEPSLGKRLCRGLGWGALYGQWWTVWIIFWELVWGAVDGEGIEPVALVLAGLVMAVVFATAGGLMGMVIGISEGTLENGPLLGIIVGVLFFALEVWLTGRLAAWNLFFWYFTGRFIGARVTLKIAEPVAL
jgi:hypothetical protein